MSNENFMNSLPVVSKFRRCKAAATFRLSSPGNASPVRERRSEKKRREKERKREKEKNDRNSDYVADAPLGIRSLRFSVRTMRVRARTRVYHGEAAGIVIYERSFDEFADDILPRGPGS